MTFNPWTFLFEVLNFLVLAFVLYRLLYRPLRAAIDERKAATDRARDETEAARKAAEADRQQLEAKLADIDHERQAVLRKAAEQAAADTAKRLAEAEAAAKAVRDRAQTDAAQLHQDTVASLEGELGGMAVDLAGRLLGQAADASLDAQLARRLAETVRVVGETEREQVRRDAGDGAAVVESAHELDESTKSRLVTAIHELVARDGLVEFQVRPALVGGALVRIGGHVWDATVASQLAAAKAALSEGGDGQPG